MSNLKNELKKSSLQFSDFSKIFKLLPPMEQSLWEFYMEGKKQIELAKIFNRTQGDISFRLNRIKTRLSYLRIVEAYQPKKMYMELSNTFTDFEIDMIYSMVYTTCQSETADFLNKKYDLKGEGRMNQIKVKYRMEFLLKRLKEISSGFFPLLLYVHRNLYVLHEVKFPENY